ncbi:hypothetical protein [Epibacterium ulvae]|uniref:hypothetical protein n=1 Tax=Epibacterium ulvae TaxID=1156985 RepID=UPI00248FE063|nr:hypothetical protein [Epibacterium ulvae]
MSCFVISSDDPKVTLKSYSGTFSGSKATVRINLEITDAHELAYIQRQLGDFQAAQAEARKAAKSKKPTPKPKTITKAKQLALPAPEDVA